MEIRKEGCKLVDANKSITNELVLGTHFDEGLEHERMHLLNNPKWLSYFGHRHGRHVCPIVDNILLLDTDTFL